MISLHVSRFRPQVLIIFLVALGLLFAGVRVPDSSRPHRPKPIHRVVLEDHQKSASNHFKHCDDVVAVLPNPQLLSDPISFHAEHRVVAPLYTSPLLFPNSGRAPPIVLS
jgi:hypothetical protein